MANENKTAKEYVQKGYLIAHLANCGIRTINYDEWERLCECIHEAKPADVREVVHGEWIPNRFKTLREDGWCECSVCGVGNKLYDRGVRKSDVPYIDGKPYELKNIANYCPNCGAKMDKG